MFLVANLFKTLLIVFLATVVRPIAPVYRGEGEGPDRTWKRQSSYAVILVLNSELFPLSYSACVLASEYSFPVSSLPLPSQTCVAWVRRIDFEPTSTRTTQDWGNCGVIDDDSDVTERSRAPALCLSPFQLLPLLLITTPWGGNCYYSILQMRCLKLRQVKHIPRWHPGLGLHLKSAKFILQQKTQCLV